MAVHSEPFCAHAASPSRWWVLLLITLMSMLQATLWNTFSPISDTMKLAYGWSDADFEWSVNMANISFLLALVPMNKLYERMGARCSMLVSSFFLVICGALRCLPLEGFDFLVLVQLSMLANGVTAAWANMSGPLISDLWFPVQERTLSTAVAVTGPPIGQALGFLVPAMVGLDGSRQPVQQLMWLEALCSVALLVATAIHFPTAPASPPSESVARRQCHGGYARLRSCQAWRFWVLNLCFAVPVGTYQSWCSVLNLNLAGAGHVKLSSNDIALLGSLMTLSGAAGSIAIGMATKRFMGVLKSIILLAAGLSALGFLLFAVLLTGTHSSAWALGASGVLGGFGLNCMPPLFFELVLESSYELVSEHVAASSMLLSVSSLQILVLLVPVKIHGSSLWMNWLMLATVVLCFCGVLPIRARYQRLEADLGHDMARLCDRLGV